jgi:hypothetical protein
VAMGRGSFGITRSPDCAPGPPGRSAEGDPLAFASAAAAAEVSGDDLVVVGNSGAGSVLPIVAAAIPRVVGTVVDAGLPPCDGAFSMGGDFVDTLRGLAVDGVLPTWARWWGEGVMEMLVPDDARRHSIEQELPAVPLAFFEAPLMAPAGWCSRSAAFVLLSEPYRSDAEIARSLQWPVVERVAPANVATRGPCRRAERPLDVLLPGARRGSECGPARLDGADRRVARCRIQVVDVDVGTRCARS